MAKKFVALGRGWEKIKRWFQRRKVQNYIGSVMIALFFVFACWVSMNRNPVEDKYQLIDGFYITGQRFDEGKELICYFFVYDNQETPFNNVDLIIGVDICDQVFMVREADEKGRLDVKKSLPADFPRHKIPEARKKIPIFRRKTLPPILTKSPGSPPRSPFFWKQPRERSQKAPSSFN